MATLEAEVLPGIDQQTARRAIKARLEVILPLQDRANRMMFRDLAEFRAASRGRKRPA